MVSLPRSVQRLRNKATDQKTFRSVILPSSFSSVWAEMESLFIILFVLRFLEGLQALNGSRSAFATRQDRKRRLSTFRAIQVATE
jgi:hypothetical protein